MCIYHHNFIACCLCLGIHILGINITYNASFLRQEENQYLTIPLETARTFPEPLQRLIGYARGAYALGYVDDLRDPISVLTDAAGRGLGDDAVVPRTAVP